MALVAWYRLKDLTDSGPSRLTMTPIASPVTGPDRFGQPNNAYVFNGSQQYLQRTAATQLDLSDNFTISVWIKPTAYQGSTYFALTNTFVAKGPATTYNYVLQLDDATTLAFVKRTGAEGLQFKRFTGLPSFTNIWTMVTVTITGGFVNLYLNGTYVSQLATPNIAAGTSDTLFIGAGGGGSSAFAFIGSVDDLRFYNHVLSADELRAVYQQNENGVTNFMAIG